MVPLDFRTWRSNPPRWLGDSVFLAIHRGFGTTALVDISCQGINGADQNISSLLGSLLPEDFAIFHPRPKMSRAHLTESGDSWTKSVDTSRVPPNSSWSASGVHIRCLPMCLWSPSAWWNADAVKVQGDLQRTWKKVQKCKKQLRSAQSLTIWKWFELFEMRLFDSNLWTSMNTWQYL